MIVVDASALVDALIRAPDADVVEAVLLDQGRSLHAPHLIDIETAQAIRRHVNSGAMESTRGHEALSDLAAIPLRRYPHRALLPRIWELRDNFTAYDAAYVALAETLDAALLTRDTRLAAAVRKHTQVDLA